MRITRIAFDVDDTLIIPPIATWELEETPNWDMVKLYKLLQKQGYYMIVWSGTGVEWARKWADELWLSPNEIREKKKYDDVDICFDDCTVTLARVNLKVKRINNKVKRKRAERFIW